MAIDNDLILHEDDTFTLTAAQTVNGTAVELAGAGLPIHPSAELVAMLENADANAGLDINFQVSVDGGSNYRTVGTIHVPPGFKGQFRTNVGRNLRAYRYTAANVQCRVSFTETETEAADYGRGSFFLAVGEGDYSGKKADDTLIV